MGLVKRVSRRESRKGHCTNVFGRASRRRGLAKGSRGSSFSQLLGSAALVGFAQLLQLRHSGCALPALQLLTASQLWSDFFDFPSPRNESRCYVLQREIQI